jgi:orotate phosphoribosyltransferase
MTKTHAKEIAAKLLEIKAVFLKPHDMFTWASGIKSPIYCDNRITLSYPELRTYIKNAFVELIKKEFADVEVIAGVATAGIPQAALIADAMNLPLIYVRSSAKDHGRTNLIEGKIEEGQKVVLIEDLISTGSSSLKVIDALKEAQVELLGLVSIFNYGLKSAKNNLQDIKTFSLSSYDELLDAALEKAYIQAEDIKLLQNWKENL